MTAWLLKTEPSAYSFQDLKRLGKDMWEGVRNPTALKNLRGAQVGDTCVIYHTGSERRAVGLATVQRTAYPDPTSDNEKHVTIDVQAGDWLNQPVGLDVLKTQPLFSASALVRQGRLSVVELTPEQYDLILSLAGGTSPQEPSGK